MMLELNQQATEALGGAQAIQNRVTAFTDAIETHKYTEGVPAPTEHPIIEEIVKRHGGEFSVDVGGVQVPVNQNALVNLRVAEIKAEAARRIVLVMKDHDQRNYAAWFARNLTQHGPDPREWPEELQAINREALDKWSEIDRLRARSDELEDRSRSGTLNGGCRDDELWTPAEPIVDIGELSPGTEPIVDIGE